jgi:hypothetical protein
MLFKGLDFALLTEQYLGAIQSRAASRWFC